MTEMGTHGRLRATNRSLSWMATLSGMLLSIVLVELFDSVNLQTGRGNLAIANPIPTAPQPASPIYLSQVSISAQQGTQVSINGQLSAASWSQWQSGVKLRTGISDAGLLKTVGIQLLNSETVNQQPIQWFSQSASPVSLPTRLTSTVRYLDITDLAQQFGWQMQVSGKTLQITTPAAKVLAVRQGKQPWGDRIVIELDRPVPWQTDPQSQEFLLTLSAQVNPSLQPLKPTPGTYLQSLKLEPSASQTRLRLGISVANLRPRIWSLSNPNRIVVDVRPDSLVEQTIAWAPGVRWRQQILAFGTTRVPVVWLEINPRQPGVSVKPILPNPTSMLGTAPLVQTAQQSQVAAAINGGFFNRIRQLPLGAVRMDGRWLSGPILNRGAIAWNSTGDTWFGRLTLRETLITQTGQRFPLTHLNSGYIQAGIARYTSDWGSTYTSLSDNEILVSVQTNRVVTQQTIEKAGSASVSIPVNGYLLVLRSNKSAVAAFPSGSTLQLDSLTDPPEFNRYPQIVGAGPLLLQNRQIVLDAKAESFSSAFAAETAARSAIARTANGTLLLIAIHNRLDGVGITLSEFTQLLQQLGAVDALNLDGGSSTTLYLGEQLLDRPPRTAARVHNSIGVFINPKP